MENEVTIQMMNLILSPIQPEDQIWLPAFLREHWGSEEMMVHETVFHPAQLPGICARINDEIVGLLTYEIRGKTCEIVSLDSLHQGMGIGSALMSAAETTAQTAGCERVKLITTNDNLNALRFYQKRGYRLVRLRPGAVDQARQRKPQIPIMGENDIPIHDELELEKAV